MRSCEKSGRIEHIAMTDKYRDSKINMLREIHEECNLFIEFASLIIAQL